jgi:hypothetical protein
MLIGLLHIVDDEPDLEDDDSGARSASSIFARNNDGAEGWALGRLNHDPLARRSMQPLFVEWRAFDVMPTQTPRTTRQGAS